MEPQLAVWKVTTMETRNPDRWRRRLQVNRRKLQIKINVRKFQTGINGRTFQKLLPFLKGEIFKEGEDGEGKLHNQEQYTIMATIFKREEGEDGESDQQIRMYGIMFSNINYTIRSNTGVFQYYTIHNCKALFKKEGQNGFFPLFNEGQKGIFTLKRFKNELIGPAWPSQSRREKGDPSPLFVSLPSTSSP